MKNEKHTENEEPTPADRKERVIHTRVPAVLEQELKRLAESLNVPVSNVVRTVLEDAVAAVDSVGQAAEGELRHVADRLRRHRDALRSHHSQHAPVQVAHADEKDHAPLEGVVGYQPLLLAREERCSLCARTMQPGEQAFLGIRDRLGPRVLVGQECLPFAATENK